MRFVVQRHQSQLLRSGDRHRWNRLAAWLDNTLPNGGCNASLNYIHSNAFFLQPSDTGILCDGCDNNWIEHASIFSGAGTGHSIDFTIHSNAGLTYPANSNHVKDISASNAMIFRGQTTFPSCMDYGTVGLASNACTFGIVEDLDQENSTPVPVRETGACVTYTYTDGFSYYTFQILPTMGDYHGGAFAADAQRGSSTLPIQNSGSDHIRLIDQASPQNVWGININGTDGNLRLNHIAGNGSSTETSVDRGRPHRGNRQLSDTAGELRNRGNGRRQ